MRLVISSSLALIVLVSMATGTPVDSELSQPKPIYNVDEAPLLFEKFIKDYDRNYKNDADRQAHYEAFVKSLKTINKLNSDPNQGATFGINLFADQTEEERAGMRGLRLKDQ